MAYSAGDLELMDGADSAAAVALSAWGCGRGEKVFCEFILKNMFLKLEP